MLRTCNPDDLHIGLFPLHYVDYSQGSEKARDQLLSIWGLDKATQIAKEKEGIQRQYNEGLEHWKAKRWEKALIIFTEVQKIEPGYKDVIMRIGHLAGRLIPASKHEKRE